MNYLAHIFLSGDHPDYQLGGFLGDFVKGPLDGESLRDMRDQWSQELLQGIRLHRSLDAFVDAWSPYQGCIALLGPEYRRWGGVAMDVFFDHLLARQWDNYSDIALSHFSADFYRWSQQRSAQLPASAQQFIERASARDLWNGYADITLFLPVLQRIDQRVRFATNLIETGEQLLDHYDELERRFAEIMPQLIHRAESMRVKLSLPER